MGGVKAWDIQSVVIQVGSRPSSLLGCVLLLITMYSSWMAPCSFLTTWTIGLERRVVMIWCQLDCLCSSLFQGDVLECISLYNIENVTFTSSGIGTLDGNGETWWWSFVDSKTELESMIKSRWGLPGIGYLVRGENRPRLIEVKGSRLKSQFESQC